jgi:hypothetical protein
MSTEETLPVNGVDGATGQYIEQPRALEDMARTVQAKKDARLRAQSEAVRGVIGVPCGVSPGDLERTSHAAGAMEDARLLARSEAAKGVFGLPYGATPLEMTTVGWAIVAHDDEKKMICDALAPLYAYRKSTIGPLVRCLTYSGQSRARWLSDHDVGGSDIDPTRVPYYLLFAGSSAKIPFRVVHELAVDYVVGRLEFATPDEYRRYAEQVVAHEMKTNPTRARRVVFFGPRHDRATELSADLLLVPLAAEYEGTRNIGATATKARLAEILCEPPDILFTANHGVRFDQDDPRQSDSQGALLCQDWPGPGNIHEDHYFRAADVPCDRSLEGLISFHFACYGAGTPEKDRFSKRTAELPRTLTKTPFIAALPKELLRRGALAVVGHVDRAWSFSIASGGSTQIAPFRNFLDHVLAGESVGHAISDFADRYASYAVQLTGELERSESEDIPPKTLVDLWTQRNDAEAYLVIGDPAVHL